jgi:hypothetical protein
MFPFKTYSLTKLFIPLKAPGSISVILFLAKNLGSTQVLLLLFLLLLLLLILLLSSLLLLLEQIQFKTRNKIMIRK